MPDSAPARDAAYQGAPGAYSEEAARALLGPAASLLPCATLEDVFAALETGLAMHAVVPIENCLTGAVPHACELVLAQDRPVIAEAQVRIDHVLIAAAGTRFEDIRRVLSHPVALAQCRGFFSRHAAIEAIPVFDTAGAVDIVMREADGRSAALASRRSASLYGAAIVAERIQDHVENWTRFLLVGPPSDEVPADGARKALISFDLPHEPGALWHALEPLAARGVNLSRIQSHPVHGRPFEYRFMVEMTAANRAELQGALEDMRDVTVSLRIAGEWNFLFAYSVNKTHENPCSDRHSSRDDGSSRGADHESDRQMDRNVDPHRA